MTTWAADLVNGVDTTITVSMGSTGSITGATRANPCVITSTSHGLNTGDYIYITGVVGMTQLNSGSYTVTYIDANSFSIDTNSSGFTAYTSGGTWTTSVTKANPAVVTIKSHGLSNGQLIYITGVVGMTNLNNIVYKVASVSGNRFSLTNTSDVNINSTSYATYTSGGTVNMYSKIITAITKANPAVVTSTSHGFSNGQKVYFDVQGMTELHKFIGTVANVTTDTFEISGVNSSSYGTFTSGTVRRPYLTLNTVNGIPDGILNTNDEVYVAYTWKDDSSVDVGSGNIVWTNNSATVTTSVSLVGTVSVGDFIGKTSAVGTGWDGVLTRPEVFYRVSAITSSTITLVNRYVGTTATVSSISRLRSGTEIRDTGSSNVNAVTWSRSGITVEGGYDFSGGTITRNGETWFTHVTKGVSFYTLNLTGGSTFKYFGLISNTIGAGIAVSNVSSVLEYSFIHNNVRDGLAVSSGIVRYCSSVQANSGYAGFISSTNGLVNYCYSSSSNGVVNTIGFKSDSAFSSTTNCVAENCNIGFTSGSANIPMEVENCTAKACSNGAFYYNSHHFINCTFDGCTYGILTSVRASRGCSAKNCTFTSCTIGAYANGVKNIVLENCSYTSCGRDVYADAESSIYIQKHTSTTPTTFAIDVTTATGDVYISNFSIDAPSVAKAISSISGTNNTSLRPIYTVQASPQIVDGSYYYIGSYIKETTNYRTSSPAMKLQLNGTYLWNYGDMKIFSVYSKSGVAKTITFYMKTTASWSGTIIPYFKLNGATIETETSITSISSASWQQFVLSCSAGSITSDGELSLEFNVKANSQPIYLDDFTVS